MFDLVINYDVPLLYQDDGTIAGGDPENFMERLSNMNNRKSRYVQSNRNGYYYHYGISTINLIEGVNNEKYFNSICEHLALKDKIHVFEDVELMAAAFNEHICKDPEAAAAEQD